MIDPYSIREETLSQKTWNGLVDRIIGIDPTGNSDSIIANLDLESKEQVFEF